MIGVDQPGDYEKTNELVVKIIRSATKLKSHKVVAKLKELVPEFKSNNSTFERLDKAPLKAPIKDSDPKN